MLEQSHAVDYRDPLFAASVLIRSSPTLIKERLRLFMSSFLTNLVKNLLSWRFEVCPNLAKASVCDFDVCLLLCR